MLLLWAGCATISWDPPKRDGGLPIKYYTVTSRMFGEDGVKRHQGLKESFKIEDAPSNGLVRFSNGETTE